MKKYLYLLITITIINFFLPFGLSLTDESKQKNIAEAVENCNIVSAGWNPAGEQEDDFYNDGTTGGDKTAGNIIIKTKNCVDKTDINLTIYESDGLTSLTDDSWNDSNLDKRIIEIPTDNFTVSMELGEEDCENLVGGGIGYDCDLYFALRQGNVVIYDSFNNPSGLLYYDCDALCQANAKLLTIIPNGSNNEPINIDLQNPTNTKNEYRLLAPIGGLKEAPNDIGEYFNKIFIIAIGLCGALAVIMIVIGGIQYMGNESIFGQTEAKKKITAAVLGLIIALGSYALLNTINPSLLGKDGVTIAQVSAEIIDLPDAGDGTVDPDFKKGGGTYSTDAVVSSEVTNVVSKIKQGWEINQFKVYTNNRMLISIKKGTEIDNTNIINIKPGINGYAPTGTARVGDKKTPIGSWKILSIKTSKDGQPVYSKSGANMGASFWLLSPMTSGERGIGMHGNKNGTLSGTFGCIRLKNADLLALLPYVKPGIIVNVVN